MFVRGSFVKGDRGASIRRLHHDFDGGFGDRCLVADVSDHDAQDCLASRDVARLPEDDGLHLVDALREIAVVADQGREACEYDQQTEAAYSNRSSFSEHG